MKTTLLFAFVTLIFVGAAFAATLVDPTVLSSASAVWGITLEVRINRVVTEQVNFTTRSYCYNSVCSYPGPTISVKPGDQFTLTLVNTLTGSEPHNMSAMNSIHYPNTTNIHTVSSRSWLICDSHTYLARLAHRSQHRQHLRHSWSGRNMGVSI